MGTPLPLPKAGGQSPQFSTHVYCGQTAGWMKLVSGMVVGLSPGDFVLDVDPVPFPKKRAEPPQIFGPCLLWPNGWMDQDVTWHEGRPQPGDFVLDGDPDLPSQKGGGARGRCPPIFSSCLLWPNGCMDQDGTWHGCRPWSSPHCARWGHSFPSQ